MKYRTFCSLYLTCCLVLMACATTPEGKVYQVGNVLAALGNAVAAACEQGTLDQPTCVKASVGYDQAAASWALAARLARTNQSVSAQVVEVLGFILTTTETLRFAGVQVPETVNTYVKVLKGGLQ